MSFMQIALVFIFLLFAANMITGGDVWNEILSSRQENLTKVAACAVGTYFYPPIINLWGINVPFPEASDLMIGAIISMILYYIFRDSLDLKFYHGILLLIGILAIMKLIAFWLVLYAGAECYSFMLLANEHFFLPFSLITMIVGIPVLIMWFVSFKKG